MTLLWRLFTVLHGPLESVEEVCDTDAKAS